VITTSRRVDAALDDLMRAQLVRALDGSYSNQKDETFWFKHVLIQDTALSTLLRGEHKRLNLLVAQSIESIYAAQLDEYAPQLAQHYGNADDEPKALEYATRAGDQAMRVYANAEAIAFYEQALDAAAKSDATTEQWTHLYEQQGRAYELSARYESALAVYDAMERTGRERGDLKLALAAQMARLPIYGTPTPLHDSERAEVLATEALEFARALGDRAAEAKALWLRMLVSIRSWRPKQGIQDGEESLALARELHLVEQEAYSLNDLASSYFALGEYNHGSELSMQARELWRRLDNKPMLADNLAGAANGMVFVGDLDKVIELSNEAFRITESIGNLWGQSYSLLMVGQAYEERGDYTLAISAMNDCIRYGEEARFIVPLVQTRAYLAQAYDRLGAREHAVREIKRAQAIHLQRGATHPVAVTLRVRLYLIAGMLDEAEAEYRSAFAQLNELSRSPNVFRLFLVHADIDLAMARHEYARALPLLDAILQDLKVLGIRFYLPEALFKKGQVLLELDHPEAAYAALLEGKRAAKDINSRRMGWQINAALASIERKRGKHQAAQKFRKEARVILDYIVMHMPEEFRASFLDMPDVREVYASDIAAGVSGELPSHEPAITGHKPGTAKRKSDRTRRKPDSAKDL